MGRCVKVDLVALGIVEAEEVDRDIWKCIIDRITS